MPNHTQVIFGEVLAGDFLSDSGIFVTERKVREHRRTGGFAGMNFLKTLAPRVYCRTVLCPRQLHKGHHRRAQIRRRDAGVGRHRD